MHFISSIACILRGTLLSVSISVSEAAVQSRLFGVNVDEHRSTTLPVLIENAVSCATKKDFARTYGYIRIIQRRLISSLGTPDDQIVQDALLVCEKLSIIYEEMPNLKCTPLSSTMFMVDGGSSSHQAIIMLSHFSTLNSLLLDAVETFPRLALSGETVECLKSILEFTERAAVPIAVLEEIHHSHVSNELAEKLLTEAVEALKEQYFNTCNMILTALSTFSCKFIPQSIARLLETLIMRALDLQSLRGEQKICFD